MSILRRMWFLLLAVAVIAVGYWALAAGRLNVGPALLVLGYCVLLPWFLWRSFQKGVGE